MALNTEIPLKNIKKYFSHFSVPNLIFITALCLFFVFIAKFLIDLSKTLSLILVSYRILTPLKQTPSWAIKFRQACLVVGLSTLCLSFFITPKSLLYLLMTAPMSLLIIHDIIRSFIRSLPPKSNQTTSQYLQSLLSKLKEPDLEVWSLTFASLPFLYQSTLATLSQIPPAIFSFIPGLTTLVNLAQLSIISPTITLLSLAGACYYVYSQRDALKVYCPNLTVMPIFFDLIQGASFPNSASEKTHSHPDQKQPPCTPPTP